MSCVLVTLFICEDFISRDSSLVFSRRLELQPRIERERMTMVKFFTFAIAYFLHYEPLKPFYTIPADSGRVLVPVVIKNIDPALTSKSVVLGVRVVGGGDFSATLPVSIRSKRIIYSNRLEQPEWWAWWVGNLGAYSRTAHQLYLISGGSALVDTRKPDAYLQIPRSLYYLENAKNFTRDPFTWVSRNPDKGYVLTKRTDGTQDYDFYDINTPNIKIYVKFLPQVNGYFFIDENGNQIIMN